MLIICDSVHFSGIFCFCCCLNFFAKIPEISLTIEKDIVDCGLWIADLACSMDTKYYKNQMSKREFYKFSIWIQ
ncbi:hypothetical protein MTBBW1_330003 [Desulfamplus magnetovallimortis]|uniref:Uncharacterized protein n=1 Tax=Desulfamplus magnetovallimortis TaxID=1246637 RepID=A0A1W1HG70_9BACT|nr:hypothetical protein MTBBW1_330003 [Desulfamplus magnetovallimortis]